MHKIILELLKTKQFSKLRTLLCEQRPADIAHILSDMPSDCIPIVFRLLPKDLAAETFAELDSDLQKNLIEQFGNRELHDIIEEMYLDDAVDMLEEMPANVVKRILKITTPKTRAQINDLLRYPDDSAGSIMTIEYVCLSPEMTVEKAFDYIRQNGEDSETIYTCYVTDAKRHLIGVVTVKDMLLADKKSRIGDLMEKDVVFATTSDNREDVVRLFDRYDFLALPVADRERRLVGIITVDDVIDVMHEETEEDFAVMAAITPGEEAYFKTSVLSTFKARIPWLMLLMLSATFTGLIISSFESALAAQVVLTAFIPMLMDTGGNSGSQSSVTVIRALSNGEVGFRDIFRVMIKELKVSALCAFSLGIVAGIKIYVIDGLLMNNADITMGIILTVSLTVAITVIFAKLIGCSLPILAQRIGFDPAVMASPFITTIVDAVSLIFYFNIAKFILKL